LYSIEINKDLIIKTAEENDTKLILQFICDLAVYEKLLDDVSATEEQLKNYLFGEKPAAEVLIAYYKNEPAGFALFFQNFSTFLGKPGLYLEDLFVKPHLRGKGIGKALLVSLAKIARERNYGRFEWSVLDWNEPSIKFYKNLGAKPMDDWTIFRVAGEALQKLADTPLIY
jgi:GNAT superfamily N-acetyltransferase